MTSDQLPVGVEDTCGLAGDSGHRADRAKSLLDDLARRTAHAQQTRVSKVRALLDHPVVRDDLTRRRVRRQLTAERFNVFDALWIDRREIYHSRFLAYLLDPRQYHDQGAVFLKAVVETIGRQMQGGEPAEWVGLLDYASCRVTTEQHAEDYGRIDLVLEFRCGTRIAIENKVDHVERTNQLPDYRKWLDKSRKAEKTRQILVFLTPDGRESADACGEYVRLSYRDLADALATGASPCSPTATPFISTLQQYIQLCRRLAEGENNMTAQSPEILELLRSPEKLEVALDLAAHLRVLEEEIKTRFRNRVIELLNESLRTESDSGLWIAGKKPVWGDSYVCIRTARDDQSAANSNYSCGVYLKFSGVIEGGWHRPGELKAWPADRDTQDLENGMHNNGYGAPTGWWVGVANLADEIPNLCSWTAEDILAIHRDNCGEGEQASKVANWIWERFDKYRDDIGRLASFKRAAGQAE